MRKHFGVTRIREPPRMQRTFVDRCRHECISLARLNELNRFDNAESSYATRAGGIAGMVTAHCVVVICVRARGGIVGSDKREGGIMLRTQSSSGSDSDLGANAPRIAQADGEANQLRRYSTSVR